MYKIGELNIKDFENIRTKYIEYVRTESKNFTL